MSRPAIVMPAPLPDAVIAALDARFTLHRWWQIEDQAGFLAREAGAIRGLAANTLAGRVDAAWFDRFPALEIVASFGVGYDHVDAAGAAARGIVVTNTPGVLDDEVADLTVALLLATLRRLPQADRYVRDGRWADAPFPLSSTLRGRRVGILGLGAIGKAVARRLEGFDVAVSYHGRSRQEGVCYDYYPTPVALAAASDVLIVVVDLSADPISQAEECIQALEEWGFVLRGIGGAGGSRDNELEKPVIIVGNKADVPGSLDSFQLLESRLGEIYLVLLASAEEEVGLDELGEAIFRELGIIRVYTKAPQQKQQGIERGAPFVLPEGSTVAGASAYIHKDLIRSLKYAILWGRSGKFEGQHVGRDHRLRDGDLIELHS